MASKTSEKIKVNRGTEGGDSYYITEVTTLANGGVKRETYRSDDKGNNKVKIMEVQADKTGFLKTTVLPNASVDERRDLLNSKSQLRTGIKTQVDSVSKELIEKNNDGVTESTIDKSAGGSGNAAVDEAQGDSQAADTPTTSTNLRNFGNLTYPIDISDDQDVIQFTALTYTTKQLTGFTFSGRPRVTPGSTDNGGGGGRSKGTVTLPIQSGIKDQNAAGWGEDRMTPVDIAKAGFALKTIKGGFAGMDESINKISEQLRASSSDFEALVATSFAENAANVKGLLARTQGVVQNPNLELLFQKPSLRPFSFQFRLSARNKDEAAEIIKIIRFFKQNMAPQKGGGSGGESANLFLKAPNTFQVHYIHRKNASKEHPFIGRIKECAMTSLEVDYTPDGNYSTYEDGMMTSYTISMSLKELEPVFYEDYEQFSDTEIGF